MVLFSFGFLQHDIFSALTHGKSWAAVLTLRKVGYSIEYSSGIYWLGTSLKILDGTYLHINFQDPVTSEYH